MTPEIATDNPRSPWTTERVAMLRSYFNAGLSCAQIAQEIGVSRNAVIGKMNRLGLSRGRRAASPAAPAAPRPGARMSSPSGWRSGRCSPRSLSSRMW